MRLEQSEAIGAITIGRRVQYRTVDGKRVERVSKTFTAVYRDAQGKRVFEGLGVTTVRDARNKALEIQQRLDLGKSMTRPKRISVDEMLDRYIEFCEAKGLAHRSILNYRAAVEKLRRYTKDKKLEQISQFNEAAYYGFATWMKQTKHKQGVTYANKSVAFSMSVAKQAFNWAWRQGLIAEHPIAAADLPKGRPRPQPVYTESEVEQILERCSPLDRAAVTLLAFQGLRANEAMQLRWIDVALDAGDLGKLHVRRGGSFDAPKDKEDRIIPLHPRTREELLKLPRRSERVLEGLSARALLHRVKRHVQALKLNPRLALHHFRHFFASTCANRGVPPRLCLAWLGHSSSHMLSIYYHLQDRDSERAMRLLLDDGRDRGTR